MANSKYFVWGRNDGYVSATCYMPNDWDTPDGKVTFTHLATFDEWDGKVVDFIVDAQKAAMLKSKKE